MTFQVVPRRKLLEFEKILVQEQAILRSILSVITNDKKECIGVALMNIYWANSQDVAVMEKTCVPVELERTHEGVQLFRQNSSYLFMLSEYLRLNGGEYMKRVLRPAIKHFLIKDSVHYEIDPKRIDSTENMTKRINNIIGASQFFLDTILKAVNDMPQPLRDFIRCLHAASERRFPGSGYRSIGALYFLRFVCPMIVSPKAYQLMKADKELSTDAHRGLILVAKVIQAVANESTTFEKEEYMKPLTDQVLKNVPGVHAYYDAILKDDQKGPKVGSRSSCPHQYLFIVVRFLQRDAEKVRVQLMEIGGTDVLWTKLMALVDALSPSGSKSGKTGLENSAAEVVAAPEGEHVVVSYVSPSPPLSDLNSSDEIHSEQYADFARSTSPRSLRPLLSSSSSSPVPPQLPSSAAATKKAKKEEKSEKRAAATAKKPADLSLSSSGQGRPSTIVRSNSNVASTTAAAGESSASTEDPCSNHSDHFMAP